ncbi:MAG: MFS transporter, partial [Gammaproteobacteria bacterium]
LLGLIGLTGMPYAVLMPIFADRILGGGPDALGLLMSASGIGALTGALTLAARRNVYGLGRWVAVAASGFGICLILFSLSRSFWLSAVILIVTGFMMMVEMSASNTLIQTMVPDKLRGRVMAVYSMMFMGMAPLGALVGGMLAESIGAPLTVMFGGSMCMLGGLVFAIALPGLRGEARQMILAQEMTAGSPANAVAGVNAMLPATDKRRT